MDDTPQTWDQYFGMMDASPPPGANGGESGIGEDDIAASGPLGQRFGSFRGNLARPLEPGDKPSIMKNLGEIGLPAAAAAMPALVPAAAFARLGAASGPAQILAQNASGALWGAGGALMTGGNPLYGAIGGMVPSAVEDTLRAVAPAITRPVARFIQDYTKVFGEGKHTASEATDKITGMFRGWAQKSGGVDLTTPLQAVVDPTLENGGFPAQTLGQRLAAIKAWNFKGIPDGDKLVGDVTDALGKAGTVSMSPAGTIRNILSPDTYLQFTGSKGMVPSLMREAPKVKLAGGQIRTALDDAIEAANPDSLEEITAARNAFKLASAAKQAGAGGKLSPTRLGKIVDKWQLAGSPEIASAEDLVRGGSGAGSHGHGLMPSVALGSAIAGAGEHFIWPALEQAAPQIGNVALGLGAGTLGALALRSGYNSTYMARLGMERALGQYAPVVGGRAAASAVSGSLIGNIAQKSQGPQRDWDEYFSTP